MPLQNRVNPFGEMVAYPERGTFMGNRGILHDEHRQIRRQWANRAWITCVLEFKGRQHPIMGPHSYTELFFLDEATALAAGHRPCGECRRADFNRFKALWLDANGHLLEGQQPTIAAVDRVLHAERVDPRSRTKRTFTGRLDALPDGVFVTLDDPRVPYLLWEGDLLAWSPGGYARRFPRAAGQDVTVLTPPSVVRVLAAGYVPQVYRG